MLATVALLLLAGLPWLTAGKHDQPGAALQPASVSAASRQSYVSIEQLRVGDRVLAENPERSAGEAASDTAVDPDTWRHLVLEADYRWPDGTPDPIRVETLQSPDWIATQGADVGQLVDLPLDLVEMGLPADLRARVRENRSCPTLARGPGRVVLTTVNHLHNRVVELHVRDAHSRHETLRPTCFHKFYSQTRRDWVSAQDLQPREVLAGRNSPIVVVSHTRVPGNHRVFNVTVEAEHVYHVGHAVVTAHNNGCSAPKRTLNDPLPAHPKKPTQANPHAPDPEATGPHTVVGTRIDPKRSPDPYRQGITYDENGLPLYRTDVTDHGRRDHTNPHYHPYDPKIPNPYDPSNPGNFGPAQPYIPK